MKNDSYFMDLAIKEAQKSLDEGGIPIGAVLVKDGEVVITGTSSYYNNRSSRTAVPDGRCQRPRSADGTCTAQCTSRSRCPR